MSKLNFKSKIQLAAIMIGSLGAGATEIVKSVSNAGAQTYDWEGDGPNGSGSFTGSRNEAIQHYGCEEGAVDCAIGKLPDSDDTPPVVLRKN